VVTPLVPTGLYLATLGVLGLLIGSFLNVVIYRVPAGLSLVAPGSACPRCDHPVRPYDNVPVLSWLALRARCRDCSAPISARYPLVELATAALFVAAGWKFGGTPYTVAALALMAAGVALFMIDLDHRRLPFAITGVLGALVVAGLALDVVVDGGGPVLTALISVGLWLGVYGGIWLGTAGRGMGLGDVALAPVLGLALGWLGWGATITGLMGGFVIGALVGVVLLATQRAGAKSRIPHGPFMLSGAALGLFAGEPLWQGYLGLVGLG
jgi:leader peptidase (prepilin peptidase) / N-methyltransferase